MLALQTEPLQKETLNGNSALLAGPHIERLPAEHPTKPTRERASTPASDSLPLKTVQRASMATAKNRFSKSKLLVAVAILLVVGGAAWTQRDNIAERVHGKQETVARVDPASINIHALGRLEPRGEMISVSAPSGAGDARIEKLMVSDGDRVEAGQVLATLDNERRLLAARRVAENTVAQEKARLAQTQIVVETTAASIRASLRSAEAEVLTAKDKLYRQMQLRQSSATSQEAIDDAQLVLNKANEKVAELKSNLARYSSQPGGEPVDVMLARSSLAVAEASLDKAIADLDQAYVRAPIAGTVMKVHVHAGERVSQTALLDMGATQTMMARVEVYESDIARVRNGQEVLLTAKPLEKPLRGQVVGILSFVKKQAIVDANPAANTDARVVEVLVKLDDVHSAQAGKYVDLQVRAEFVQ